MAELYMARTCKWGVLRVVGGDVWNHSGDVLITPANNRLSGREGLDAQIHAKAGQELTDVTRNICLDMRKINAPPCAVTKKLRLLVALSTAVLVKMDGSTTAMVHWQVVLWRPSAEMNRVSIW